MNTYKIETFIIKFLPKKLSDWAKNKQSNKVRKLALKQYKNKHVMNNYSAITNEEPFKIKEDGIYFRDKKIISFIDGGYNSELTGQVIEYLNYAFQLGWGEGVDKGITMEKNMQKDKIETISLPRREGCISQCYCHNCKIIYHSGICVCGYFKCEECNGDTTTSTEIDTKNYRKIRK